MRHPTVLFPLRSGNELTEEVHNRSHVGQMLENWVFFIGLCLLWSLQFGCCVSVCVRLVWWHPTCCVSVCVTHDSCRAFFCMSLSLCQVCTDSLKNCLFWRIPRHRKCVSFVRYSVVTVRVLGKKTIFFSFEINLFSFMEDFLFLLSVRISFVLYYSTLLPTILNHLYTTHCPLQSSVRVFSMGCICPRNIFLHFHVFAHFVPHTTDGLEFVTSHFGTQTVIFWPIHGCTVIVPRYCVHFWYKHLILCICSPVFDPLFGIHTVLVSSCHFYLYLSFLQGMTVPHVHRNQLFSWDSHNTFSNCFLQHSKHVPQNFANLNRSFCPCMMWNVAQTENETYFRWCPHNISHNIQRTLSPTECLFIKPSDICVLFHSVL